MTIKKLAKGLLASSVLLASLNSQAALITFDFTDDTANLQSVVTLTSGGYSLELSAFNDLTPADITAPASGLGLGVSGGGNGGRLGGSDNINFSLLGGDTFDFINVLFNTTGNNNPLSVGETATISFSDLSQETINGNDAGTFTSQTVDASSFNISGSDNGFRILGVELNIVDTITDPVSSVPEPTTLAIFSLALAGLFSRKLKR